MANHRSAAKKARQDENRRLRNRFWRSRMRTQIKKLRAALAEKDEETARTLLPATLSLIDRTARAGVLHDNTASRYKARLQRAFNRQIG